MVIFIIVIHMLVCIALIGIVLIQRGRGSGLVEIFSGVESIFGTKTNAFLTRTTTVLSSLFFITCLALAAISLKQSRSLMRDVKTQDTQAGQLAHPTQKPEEEAAVAEKAKTEIPKAPIAQKEEKAAAGEEQKTEAPKAE